MRKCNKCNQTLTISDNWSLSMEKNQLYTCKPCCSKRAKSYIKALESKTKHNSKHLSFPFPEGINFSGYTECRQYL